MKLKLVYREVNEPDEEVSYSVAATLRRNDGGAIGSLPKYLGDMPLERLAHRWWAAQGRDPALDGNAAIAAEHEEWAHGRVGDLVGGGISLKSADAMILFALAERLKRVAVMLYRIIGYVRYFEEKHGNPEHLVLSLKGESSQITDAALPPLPDNIVERLDGAM